MLLVHGGAGVAPSPRDRRLFIAAVREALRRGSQALARGAEDAVVAAVEFLEAESILNAGRGATLDREGRVMLDAGFMEGTHLRFGAVACVTRTPTPIVLARALSGDGEFGRFIAGASADALVARYGVLACAPDGLITKRARQAWTRSVERGGGAATDTVGAVGLDARGRLAAAVSTGGISLKPSGRVGDSAVVGAGFWAEAPFGACVATGIGEAMLREGSARRCVRLLGDGMTPQRAALIALAELSRGGSHPPAGLIVVASDGRAALVHTSPTMTAGIWRLGARVTVRTRWGRSTAV